MKLIHVVHAQIFTPRHMPTQKHYVGTVEDIAAQLAGYSKKQKFQYIQDLLGFLTKEHPHSDFNLVHSYEANS